MNKIAFRSPARYVQGQGVLTTLGTEVENLGTKALILSDDIVWNLLSDKIDKSFSDSKATFAFEKFNGESSNNEVQRLVSVAKDNEADVIVALGGGKAVDTAKALADEVGAPVIIAPTIASTDAPTSALSVMYTDEGQFEDYRFYKKNPDLVLVDTEVIVNAPARLFASGMADAMATLVEASAAYRNNGSTMAGGSPSLAGQAIAAVCEQTLFTEGIAAYAAVKEHLVTPAVEHVVEANTLLSGLGFENGGLAGAHAIHNGFTAVSGEIHDLTHGEKVAYGTLTQLVLENRPVEEIYQFMRFYKAISMPITLAEMHLDQTSYDELLRVGALANGENDTMGNIGRTLTAKEIADAILAVDALAKTLEK
ncbi:glycerol dehydrogenase [Jeotgalibaca porci]|uniref:Glycerol dehydrogenase n=1 Tax=Jeotgalibaca porci TaxID=1868793 RepID=A0A6G7WI64_9LACT|nr:glycerol dehydrogenase [Jeotgalibaca porci]QIK51891.1 glycerol dehydrogenase [Jeotgalibaca porci]